MANDVCFVTMKFDQPWTLENYLSIGGYEGWKKVLSEKQASDDVIGELKASGLRGRGGAGFPSGLKWSFMPRNGNDQNYVVCNADESEPGTCKDRDILRFNPHQLIEGLAIGGYTMAASVGYIYMRGEFMDEPFKRVEAALKEAYDLGMLGKNIQGSGWDFELYVVLGAGAYICGEETALIESLEGKMGRPRFKPPFPANFGVYGRPTTINNVETFASAAAIMRNGAEWFTSLGIPSAAGTKVFSVSGHVNKPGNYEMPMGTPFSELLEMAGGMLNGAKIKAVIPGGSSMPVVPGEIMMETTMDYDGVQKSGSMLGSGAVIVMDEHTCMVKVLERLSRFYQMESCGQCTPCREGTGWMHRIVSRIEHGQGVPEDLDLLFDVASNIEGKTICALGDAAAWPVKGFLRRFREEFEYHIEHKRCLVGPGSVRSDAA